LPKTVSVSVAEQAGVMKLLPTVVGDNRIDNSAADFTLKAIQKPTKVHALLNVHPQPRPLLSLTGGIKYIGLLPQVEHQEQLFSSLHFKNLPVS